MRNFNWLRHVLKNLRRPVAISIIFHFVVMLYQWDIKTQNRTKPQKKLIEVTLKRRPARSKQIVLTAKSNQKNPTKPSRFLSDVTQSVLRETVAKKNGKFKEGHKGKKGNKKIFKLGDLGQLSMKKILGNGGSNKGAEKGIGKNIIGQGNDFIDDVPLGDTTRLNTVEYKYFSFYNRIRNKLERYWGSSLKQKAKSLYHRGRKLIRGHHYITNVVVVLDEAGNIVDVKISGSSGNHFLDDAAIDSFNKAGPFPNPPRGMIVNGKAEISWGFVVRS